ncbi:response regulator transcription factor [Acetivibrio cellulolyticus]|uniref:response regulator transcription factor n=1 Tax=Acetivibrio cellulolyticus TaxID=35830 RepID=UPI0001E2D49D|nr:response regulator transcription factor [Acetivibrio cellulolyticus]
MGTKKILIIDDELSILNLVSMVLKREGYEVEQARDGNTGLRFFESFRPDLIILDIMLPDINGNEVCKMVRSNSSIPIMMLTAKSDIVDKIVGLELGADDYLTKPFDNRELLVRVKALLRRTGLKDVNPDILSYSDIVINLKEKVLLKNNKRISLTPIEYQLLELFMKNPSRVFTREDLLTRVWGYDYYGDSRTVDISITRLRKKIEDDSKNPKYIVTAYGFGYCFKGTYE